MFAYKVIQYSFRLISPSLHPLLEAAKYRYAEMLLASRLFIQATEVLKCGKSRVAQQRGPSETIFLQFINVISFRSISLMSTVLFHAAMFSLQ